MNGTSFTLFSRLPAELQFKIWDHSIGPRRIHIFRPAPLDGGHWFQDYACPIHQVLDAGTNGPLEEDILERLMPAMSCGGARESLSHKLVKADLSHFMPNAQTMQRISSLIDDESLVSIAMTTVKDARSCFRRVALLVARLRGALQHSQRTLDAMGDILTTIDNLTSDFLGILTDLPFLPESVSASIEMNIDAIQIVLDNLMVHLEEYESGDLSFDEVGDQVLVEDRIALGHVSKRANRAGMSYLEPVLIRGRPLSQPEWRLPSGTADSFNRDEARRATQRFVLAPDRDLVYVTDPRRLELFLQLWKSPWCKRVERLALLVCDCCMEMEWLGTSLIAKAELRWPDEGGPFDQTELKEIMLVVRPKERPHHCRRLAGLDVIDLPRDAYGFVDYAVVRDKEWVFEDGDVDIADENFEVYETELKMLLPRNLGREIKFRRVVDIDCESIGLTCVEGRDSIYARFTRR